MTEMEKLAERVVRHAEFHFREAAANMTDTYVDLHNIERGLKCLDLAAALRSRSAEKE